MFWIAEVPEPFSSPFTWSDWAPAATVAVTIVTPPSKTAPPRVVGVAPGKRTHCDGVAISPVMSAVRPALDELSKT